MWLRRDGCREGQPHSCFCAWAFPLFSFLSLCSKNFFIILSSVFFTMNANSFIYTPFPTKRCIYTPKMEYIVHFLASWRCTIYIVNLKKIPKNHQTVILFFVNFSKHGCKLHPFFKSYALTVALMPSPNSPRAGGSVRVVSAGKQHSTQKIPWQLWRLKSKVNASP